MRILWPDMSDGQRAVLFGGEPAWDGLSDVAQANFYAITHVLEITPLATGVPCLSEVVVRSGRMREDGRELNVSWQPGTYAAFRSAGFDHRVGSPLAHHGEDGLIKTPKGGGHGDIQGIHVLFDNTDSTQGDMHIDYLWGIGHFAERNDDVTKNYKEFQKWYGEIPGMSLHTVQSI